MGGSRSGYRPNQVMTFHESIIGDIGQRRNLPQLSAGKMFQYSISISPASHAFTIRYCL